MLRYAQRSAFEESVKLPAVNLKYPTFAELQETLKDTPKTPDIWAMIQNEARATVAMLEGLRIPAADLTNEQKCALFTLAGVMKYENGKMVSIRPVGIADDGKGGYILGIAPESPTRL